MIAAQWLLLAAWAVVVPLFVGWGVLVRWLWREPVRADAGDLLLSFWLGWAAVLLALQLAHFALPIDAPVRALVAAGGALGLLSAWRPCWRLARRLHRALPPLSAGALLAVWLSNRAAGGSPTGDTGTYYLPTIRWVIEHPLVIGLANLFAPYGYNLTYFLYAALLDAGPFAGRTHHLLNSTLLAVLAARTVLGLWRVLRRRNTSSAADVFYALMLPAEAEAATGYLFTSPAPDVAVYVLGIALSGELVALLAGPPRDQRLHFLALALLAALAPTVKLPLLGLAATAMAVGTAVWIDRTRHHWRTTIAGLALAASFGVLALAPWVAGNILMSGCPFFPSAIGALPVAWRVDWDVQEWIQGTMIIGDWQRFAVLGWTDPGVAVPAGIALAAPLLGLVAAVVRRRPLTPHPDLPPQGGKELSGLPAVALLPAFASLIMCIATTPVPRYAGATLWLLAGQSVMVLLGNRLLGPVARRATALGAVALAALPFATGAPRWLDLRDFPATPRPVVAAQRLPSGLEVYVPSNNNHRLCWDAPLPCTPRPHPGLRLRRPPDLASGFDVEPGSGPPPPAMTVVLP